MKIAGKQIRGPNVEVLVIPRAEGDLVFKCQAVLEEDEFNKLCPVPKPPEVMRPGGAKSFDVTDPEFQKMLGDWGEQKTHWLVLKSLEATPDLEWETVKMGDPSTWKNYQKELQDAGFSSPEISRIVRLVSSANGLDQKKIDEATERFLAGQGRAQKEQSSQNSENQSTPSGEPVNVSE